jgi:hypothetical protein
MDKTGGNTKRGTKGADTLNRWTDSVNTVDLWRTRHLGTRQYTWSNAGTSIQTRIDRIYISKHLEAESTANIVACPISDHDAVQTTIVFPQENPRGPGTWKLNNELLNDRGYQHEINTFLEYWLTQKDLFTTPSEWWDTQKEHLKRISIKHSVRRARSRNREKQRLLNEIASLRNSARDSEAELHTAEQQLSDILEAEAQGTVIRSRAVWQEHGEKPTRYFFGLEKKKQKQHTITALQTPDGLVTSDIDILQEAQTFYADLYTKEQMDGNAQRHFLDNISSKLQQHEQTDCDAEITTQELTAALHTMQNNKSPGKDGLTREFYTKFWNHLAAPLTEVANWNHAIESMSPSQREALLKLLYKKRTKEQLKNWRPISLLNTDYKIIAKALHMWSSRKLTIRGRALIAKTFGLATFLYLLACFTAPSQIIDRITKLTFNFIWQNGVEYVGRKTLEKPLHRGGLGIPSFRNLSQMMKLNLALKITTPANDSNWALWSRYHIGWPLANITTAWAFLRDNSRPHLDPDKLLAWYKEIAEYLQNNSEALKQLAEAMPQLTMKVLKQIGPEQPATRADQKWETLGIPEDTRAEEWKQLWSSLNTRDEQELKWRILHWTLPTKGYLSSWKRMQIDKKCPFCSEEETVTHALVTCTRIN